MGKVNPPSESHWRMARATDDDAPSGMHGSTTAGAKSYGSAMKPWRAAMVGGGILFDGGPTKLVPWGDL